MNVQALAGLGITGEIAQNGRFGQAALSRPVGGWSDQIIASAQQFEESGKRGVGGLRGEPLGCYAIADGSTKPLERLLD